MFLKQIEEHTVWPQALSPDSVVLDLGANLGNFSHGMVAQFNCRCYAAEPNPDMFKRIPHHPRLSAYNLAIAAKSGRVRLQVSGNPEASSILEIPASDLSGTVEVDAVSLEGFLKIAGVEHVDLVKFDIEGAEIAVLDSCSDELLAGIGQVTVEFHDFMNLTPVSTVHRVVRRLEGLGFWSIKMWRHAWGDTLFVNRRLTSANLLKLAWSRYATRNWWGLKRVVARRRRETGRGGLRRAPDEPAGTRQ